VDTLDLPLAYRDPESAVGAYCDDSGVRLVVATWSGTDGGDSETRFYFEHDSLLFVFQRRHPDMFSPPPRKRYESRLYFRNDTLIRWLAGTREVSINPTSFDAQTESDDKLVDASVYLKTMWRCQPKYNPDTVDYVGRETPLDLAGIVYRTSYRLDSAGTEQLRVSLVNTPTRPMLWLERLIGPGERYQIMHTVAIGADTSVYLSNDCRHVEKVHVERTNHFDSLQHSPPKDIFGVIPLGASLGRSSWTYAVDRKRGFFVLAGFGGDWHCAVR
jgi:hypothetical protein